EEEEPAEAVTELPADSAAAPTASPTDTAAVRPDAALPDSAAIAEAGATDTAATDLQELFSDTEAPEVAEGGRRFTEIFRLYQTADLPVFGAVALSDTAAVRGYLNQPAVQRMLPPGTQLLYTAKPESQSESGEPVFFVLGVR